MAKNKQAITKTERPFPLWAKLSLVFLFIVYTSVFLARQVNFVTADLGRHITNGKVTVETGKVIATNFYSYTEPDYPAINHHWGSGVIFYLVHQSFGFKGLSVFYVLTILGAALFFGAAALKFADERLVFFAAIICVPLIAYRTEVRPEGISLFFVGLFYYVLTLYREGRLKFPVILALLGIAQLIWVNCHIFFFMGFMLSAFFLIDEFLNNRNKMMIRNYLVLSAVFVAVSFINPFFINGFLAPFTIFKEYGYMIAENQTVLFMQERFDNTEFLHFEIQGIILVIAVILLLVQKKIKQYLIIVLHLIIFGLLGFMAVRGIPLFALSGIPAISFFLHYISEKYFQGAKNFIFTGLSIVAVLIVLIGFQSGYTTDKKNKKPRAEYKEPAYFSPIKYTTGIGLFQDMNLSADFFNQNNIKGPVFNNYDIGGYLIYHLYGKEKIFVDNRPEAYSVDFFKQTYIPMQEKMEKFREVEGKYNFNCIWFYRHDNTPWAQPFLLQLIEQPDYAPVFVDGLTIMFLKRNAQNAELIARYELPKSMFRSVPGS